MANDIFRDLAQSTVSQLERRLREANGPTLDSLVGFEWRGYNTGWQPRLLGIQKFVKGFFVAGGGVEGYNIPVAQNGMDGLWLHQPTPEHPKRYAFYRVTSVDPAASPESLYPAAILLDYGASKRNAGSPYLARLLRDYLVQPDPGNHDLLLGKAFLAIGTLWIASNYFVLERFRPTAWVP